MIIFYHSHAGFQSEWCTFSFFVFLPFFVGFFKSFACSSHDLKRSCYAKIIFDHVLPEPWLSIFAIFGTDVLCFCNFTYSFQGLLTNFSSYYSHDLTRIPTKAMSHLGRIMCQ